MFEEDECASESDSNRAGTIKRSAIKRRMKSTTKTAEICMGKNQIKNKNFILIKKIN